MIKNKKSQQLKSPMTLDKLSLMMGKGFNEVHEKFSEVHEKIDGVESRLGNKIDVLDNRVSKLEKQNDEILSTQDKILKDIEDLKDENIMDMAFRGRVENRFIRLEQEVKVIKEKIKI